MPKSKKKAKENHLIYFFNYLLIFSVLWLKYLDIYYTLGLIENSQVSETNPIAQFLLNFDPIIVYTVSLLPIFAFFIVNYFIRKNSIYLFGLSVLLIIFIIYLISIVQNSVTILNQI